jgi:tRNA (guanine-N7-)-methyltransferase
MRIRHKQGIEEKLSEIPALVCETSVSLQGKWREHFRNTNPIYVELGMGKGRFITTMASRQLNINFIGVDRIPEIVYLAGKRRLSGAANLRFLYIDAGSLGAYFAPGEIDRIYLNFSDPWPKKRHAKRRLTSPFFLNLYKILLKEEGEIYFKTDNMSFFEYSLSQFIGEGFSLGKITYDLHNSGYPGNIMTEYEMRFAAEGVPICRCEAFKSS